MASKYIPGEPLGEIRFYGTRPDDPNDLFPREHRRELLGLRAFCAWLNHDDSRSINTFDSLIKEGDRQYVRHYLYDFGSCLGSGSIFAQKPRAGNEYLWEAKPSFLTMISLGLWVRPWIKVDYPHYPSIGNFEGDFFRAEKWRPEYSNPAFENMLGEDAFWAARIVMSFTDEQIRAIVHTGGLTDAAVEKYLADTLIKRRDKVGKVWLTHLNPIDRLEVRAGQLVFDNAALRFGVVRTVVSYSAQWQQFDNLRQNRTPVGARQTLAGTSIPIPENCFEGPVSSGARFAVVEISAHTSLYPSWAKTVSVFLRRKDKTIEVVGIERE